MMSVNLMFHLSSVLVFFVLIYFLLRQQQRLRFHERLWALIGSRQSSVRVDWPRGFLESLCQAWQLAFSWDSGPGIAQRIDPKAWVDCHLALGIIAIRSPREGQLLVEIREPDPNGQWQKTLEAALSGRYRVELRALGKSKGSESS